MKDWRNEPRRRHSEELKAQDGWPRMWKELLARGIRVGKERVRS